MEFKNLQNEIHIWAVDLDHVKMPGNEAEERLPTSERDKSERFRFETIRTRYAKCRFLLRVLLGQYLGVEFYNQEFHLNQHGKPSLESIKDRNPIFFNASNSENICLYAFMQNGEIGIDIEKIHDLSDMGRIVERFFSPVEIKTFYSLPEHNRKKTFFKYWTRKESLLKAMGVGLSFPLDKVDVITGGEEEMSEVFIKTEELNMETEWTLRDINVFEGFAAALALEGKHLDCRARVRYFRLVNEFLTEPGTMSSFIYQIRLPIALSVRVSGPTRELVRRV
jgi:4'-phosphopantetheinyl transferase